MKTIRIERVLLGHLAARGMRRDDIALLIRAAQTSTTAHRVLATAAESTVRTRVPCPVDGNGHRLAEWTGEPVAIATIALSKDYGWIAGELLDPRGTIPQTLALAAVGRPFCTLLQHRDVDPDAIITVPLLERAIAAVPMETVALTIPPFPIGRLKLWTSILRQRRSEKMADAKINTWLTFCSLIIGMAVVGRLASGIQSDFISISGFVVTALSGLVITMIAIDSVTGRLLSEWLVRRKTTSHEMMAAAKHRDEVRAWHIKRGFDDDGTPKT